MSNKSMLVAFADPQAFEGITEAMGDGWEVTSVFSEADALSRLEQGSFDALLVDFNLGSPDASELLDQALAKRPEAHRFLLAYEADLALVAAKVSGPHEILPKPVELASLKSRIEGGLTPPGSEANPGEAATAAGAGTAPVVPAIYSDVLKVLESDAAAIAQAGEMIAGDEVLRTEVLKLANSAYLKLRREITDPVEAVEWLGPDAVKALVMALRFLAEHSHLRPGYLDLEALWQHSTNVAQLARDLVLLETKDRALAQQALVAGLVHDLGKVVLATNFDDLYARVHSLGRKQPVALWDIEKEMFGASHGEIGACLVGMWNLPGPIVEAAAFHHEPPLGEHQEMTPLAAVHVANVLEHQRRSSEEFRVAPVISPAFLNELGLLERLPFWRAALASSRGGDADLEAPLAEASEPQISSQAAGVPSLRTANELQAPASATATATSGQPESDAGRPVAAAPRPRRWVYAGFACVVLLALWLDRRQDLPVRGLTPAPTPVARPVAEARVPASEPKSAALPGTTPAPAVAEPAAALAANPDKASPAAPTPVAASPIEPAVIPDPAPAAPEPLPTAAKVQQTAATTPPAPARAPVEKPEPEFRVNGIIYTVARPVAIVNGRTVFVGDSINGATVVSIGRTEVTLKINGQRKLYVLQHGSGAVGK